MIGSLSLFGAQTGVGMLRWLYPGMARGELGDILRGFREDSVRGHGRWVQELEWTRPGAVWAMDHKEPPEPVDGVSGAVLSVREVASGAQLLWEGQVGPRGELVAAALEELFLRYGPPLVLKADNGSAFIAEEVVELLRRWGLILLWSPPRMPRDNGSCESGIRWMSSRTENLAAQAGRSGSWRKQDLQVAMELENQLPKRPQKGARPRGEVFAGRERIGEEARSCFQARVADEREIERRARGIPPAAALTRNEQAQIDRAAIRRALVAHGILNLRTRRVSLTLKSLFRAKIS